jgi:hypothetical protein
MSQRNPEERRTSEVLAELINRVKRGVLQVEPKVTACKRVPMCGGSLQSRPQRRTEEICFVEGVE